MLQLSQASDILKGGWGSKRLEGLLESCKEALPSTEAAKSFRKLPGETVRASLPRAVRTGQWGPVQTLFVRPCPAQSGILQGGSANARGLDERGKNPSRRHSAI